MQHRVLNRGWSPAPGYIEGIYYGDSKGKVTPEGPSSVDKFPLLTEALVRHGYQDDDSRKILGGNLLRLYERVLG